MWGMLTLILALVLQRGMPATIGPRAGADLNIIPHLQGKVIDDLKQPARVHLSLKDERTNTVITSTDSFANGTFYLENITFGLYVLSVSDPRYLLKDTHLDLRDASAASSDIIVQLVRNGGAPAPQNNRTVYLDELDKLNMAAIAASTTPAAFAEFQKGVDLARLGTKRNDIVVPASGNPEDDTAEMHFKKAVSIAPDFYEGQFQLGLEQIRSSHIQDAAGTLDHAVTMNPGDARPLRVLSEIYLQQKQFQKTVDSLVKVGTMGSLNADDRFHLGVAFDGLNNPSAAQQQFSVSISLAPGKNPQAYLLLHNEDAKMNQLPEAIAVLEDFVRLFPNDPNRKMAEDRIKKLRDAVKKSNPF
jgi:tetratricopeptide (TPR) repeat protein